MYRSFDPKKPVCFIALAIALSACRHPIEIVGQGSVQSSSTSRDCSASESPCNNEITGDYVETYTAVPDPGWRFVGWEGCGNELTARCHFNLPAAVVSEFAGESADPLVAIFEEVGDGPVAAFAAEADFERAARTVTFDGTGSVPGTSDIVRYRWNYGDNSQGMGASSEHRYSKPGTYTVSLTVIDGDDNRHTTSHDVYVANGEDPLFPEQWHLENTGQAGFGSAGTRGEDVNVQAAWARCGVQSGCRGEGVTVAVVDDGLETRHPDLRRNVVNGSFDYRSGGTEPTPRRSMDSHGTSVAGIIAARGYNDAGLVGIAPFANLVAYSLIASDHNPTDADEANAASRGIEDVSNNSWGPEDNTGGYFAAPRIWRDAIDSGLNSARGGKGRVYVWSAGNGAPEDISGQDGYAGYRGVIAVGALNDKGRRSSYSEPGANLIVSAPGGEFCDTHTIVTTDLTGNRGQNRPNSEDAAAETSDRDYTRCFNGTSAAAPMVSGVVALMLQANAGLSWRDVRTILASTARKNHAGSSGWQTNGAGFDVHHDYGFGAVDAGAAVNAARQWQSLPAEKSSTHRRVVDRVVPDNRLQGISTAIDVVSPITYVEGIELRVIAQHSYNTDLGVTLVNLDTGTESQLAGYAPEAAIDGGIDLDHTFYSARHLGENANARWRVTVFDRFSGDEGVLEEVEITFYGH